jgi:hypothetical protein
VVRPVDRVVVAGDAGGCLARTQGEAFAGGKGESEDAARRRLRGGKRRRIRRTSH